MHILLPACRLSAVEINKDAINVLRNKNIEAFHESLLTFMPTQQWDLVITSGVLIHIAPQELMDVYNKIEQCSAIYVCLAEYYNPTPVEVSYRCHSNRLFKRDFAGEFLKDHPEFFLRKYGFVYHGDPCFPADDITWFLLERRQLTCQFPSVQTS